MEKSMSRFYRAYSIGVLSLAGLMAPVAIIATFGWYGVAGIAFAAALFPAIWYFVGGNSPY